MLAGRPCPNPVAATSGSSPGPERDARRPRGILRDPHRWCARNTRLVDIYRVISSGVSQAVMVLPQRPVEGADQTRTAFYPSLAPCSAGGEGCRSPRGCAGPDRPWWSGKCQKILREALPHLSYAFSSCYASPSPCVPAHCRKILQCPALSPTSCVCASSLRSAPRTCRKCQDFLQSSHRRASRPAPPAGCPARGFPVSQSL